MTRRSTSRGIIYTAPPSDSTPENTGIESETGETTAVTENPSRTDTAAADD